MDIKENGKSQTDLNRLEKLLLPGKKIAEADEELRRLLKIAYQICYIAVIMLSVLGVSSLILRETVLGIANISFALLLVGYLEFYRRSDIDFNTVNIQVLAATGAFIFFVTFFSGVERPTILWSYLYPLAAFAFLGRRRGTTAVIIYYAAVCSMFLADPNLPGITNYENGMKFVFSISYPLVSILSYFYEDQREKYQISLRRANEEMEQRIYERTAQLARSEEKYRAIIENMEEGYFEVDLTGRISFFNESARKFLGYSPEESMGLHYKKYMDEENANKVFNLYREVYKTRVPKMDFDWEVIRKDGTWRTVEGSASLISDADGQPIGFRGLFRDTTERKRVHEELRESERRLANIVEFLPDATFVIDRNGIVIAWNRAMEEMSGIKKEEMIGRGNYEYSMPFYGERRPMLIDLALDPDLGFEDKYSAVHRAGDILFGESLIPHMPTGNVHLAATATVLRNEKGEIIAAIECIRDNTEHKSLQERLNRAEKMEVLGRLAGGVAHDLNNVLGVLVGYSELLRDSLPGNSVSRNYAGKILNSGVKGAAIIQDLLTLARRGVSVSQVVNLNKLAFDFLGSPEFEKMSIHHPGVNIRTEFEEGLLNVKGSPIHLGKTIMNLVSNAMEAISGHGEVTIRTENRYLDKPIAGYDDMKEGDYAVVSVSDNGIGITANDLSRIFEPFYTKKVMGRSGTGLGLAVVWGTVKDHNGYIDVRSEEGRGSTFTVYFPVTREQEVPVQSESVSSYMSRGECILVVDDVSDQRELAASMLGKLGYRVAAAASGEEAVEYLKDNKADLIILDMIMDPGIDGMETYKRIRKINPLQKAIIVSGYSETDRVRSAQEMGAGVFVRKPYVLEKIGLAVRRELDGI
jgi:PAS domain S-box-containing protein